MTKSERIIFTLMWMLDHFDWENKQTGLEQPDSTELKDAKTLLQELADENEMAIVLFQGRRMMVHRRLP